MKLFPLCKPYGAATQARIVRAIPEAKSVVYDLLDADGRVVIGGALATAGESLPESPEDQEALVKACIEKQP